MPPPDEIAADLDRRFGILGLAHVKVDAAGSPTVRLASEKFLGEIHLHGAHVTSWKPANSPEVIFMSSKATFADGKAIRGGIPICFPWFRAKAGDPNAPSHGFVRTKLWTLDSIKQQSAGVTVTMSTASDDATRKWWPADFRARLDATFGSALELAFTVTNTGTAPIRFAEALHTYYRVGNVRQTRVSGLDGAKYFDNNDGNREKTQQGDVTFTQATDNAYVDTQSALELLDANLKRRIHLAKQNSGTTVIWNPWQEAAGKMSDMGENEWPNMLCAEAANILANEVDLAPGKSHTLRATTTVMPY